MTSPIPPSLASTLSDRYRVEREVGRGGMAAVYLAEDLKHGRRVAIKVLSPELGSAIGRERFLQEITTAARLTHPHILPLYDSGASGDLLYYVTPYIEGETLRERLTRERQLQVGDALRLTREVGSALAHAHHHGVIHRDVKPENILLSDGIALLADFGIARPVATAEQDETRVVTAPGAIWGTPRYMSPEQAAGGDVDSRGDLYALACVLYEMLAGRPPFTASTPDALMRMHVAAEAEPVTTYRASLPPGIAPVLARGLAKAKEDRYATAARFAEALDAAAGGGSVPAAPAPPSTPVQPNNLPRPRTRFIGREREMEECTRLLGATRLLTLTGIGGSGKTRLAIQIAERVLPQLPGGAWFVDLAPLSEAERVPDLVATALGVKEEAGKPLADSIARMWNNRRALLVLDNCEHLLSACAELADALLARAPETSILATSREGLGVEGERIVALRSLAVPSTAGTPDLRSIEASDAVRLFVDRAQAAAEEFALTAANAPTIVEICRQLDGIPLAIELAAARTRVLSVEQIREKLDDRFRLLTGGSRTALPRHQTLRATLQWSYDQLAPEEQRLFRSLAVFAGGWTLDLAARVAGAGDDEFTVLELLARLVDKSLVLVDREPDSDPRYRFLETVRQYGLERLVESGETESIRDELLAEFLALTERAHEERFTREDFWARRLEVEHDNLRSALQHAAASDPERYLELAGRLAWFWQARTHLLEGESHTRASLLASESAPPRPARARALQGAANLVGWQGDAPAGIALMDEALAMWRALGAKREVASALEGLGWIQILAGREEGARDTLEECLQLMRELGDPVLVNRARVGLAQAVIALGDTPRTRELSTEIIEFSSRVGDVRSEHSGWHYLADTALIDGNCQESYRLYQKSLALARATGDRIETAFEIQGVAMSLAGLGQRAEALRLQAAVEAEFQRLGVDPHMRFWDELQERYLGEARRRVGPSESQQARQSGLDLPFDAAIEEALRSSR